MRAGRFAGVAVLSLSPAYISQVTATIEAASIDEVRDQPMLGLVAEQILRLRPDIPVLLASG